MPVVPHDPSAPSWIQLDCVCAPEPRSYTVATCDSETAEWGEPIRYAGCLT